jgi:hypothetical protein
VEPTLSLQEYFRDIYRLPPHIPMYIDRHLLIEDMQGPEEEEKEEEELY